MDLNELLDVARTAGEPQPVDRSKVGMGGVDPLGLRQINFGLMDRVLPDLNNVASHIRPYTLMAWAWRRVRHILERGRRQSAQAEEMRDFVDRIEAIYAWSQFLIDPKADIPGAQAMRPMLDTVRYRFGGEEWEARRNMRRYSTGFISPLNYGRGLADARNRGKTILRLRIVMDEGGWTLTPGTTRQGNPPEPTPDRLETATNLLVECGRL